MKKCYCPKGSKVISLDTLKGTILVGDQTSDDPGPEGQAPAEQVTWIEPRDPDGVFVIHFNDDNLIVIPYAHVFEYALAPEPPIPAPPEPKLVSL